MAKSSHRTRTIMSVHGSAVPRSWSSRQSSSTFGPNKFLKSVVGTQLHGRDSHAGLSCQLAPDSGWDSHAGTSLLTSWYLPSMAGLPRWYSNTVTLTLQSYSQVTQLPLMTQVTPKLILPRIAL